MDTETRNCQNCKQNFTIEPDDFSFYEKMKVPAPHVCPDCRFKTRATWRNEMSLYNSTCYITKNKIIAIVDAPINYVGDKINVDAIIITKNPKLYISQLQQVFNCKQIIFDGCNSSWKLNYWKKDCDSLHLPYHICALQGAFEMDL